MAMGNRIIVEQAGYLHACNCHYSFNYTVCIMTTVKVFESGVT